MAALVDLQEEDRTWLENLPQNLESSKLASKPQTISELDLEELQGDRSTPRLRPGLTQQKLLPRT